jgi:hypothetical protein
MTFYYLKDIFRARIYDYGIYKNIKILKSFFLIKYFLSQRFHFDLKWTLIIDKNKFKHTATFFTQLMILNL